jgi:hypothetical protein
MNEFTPQHPIHTPSVRVTPVDDPKHPLKPMDYFLNGYIRHQEKLSGSAGDVRMNKQQACETP